MLYFWIFLTIALVAIEAATVQLVTVWFAIGSLAALVSELFKVPFPLQVVIFVVVSLISLIATRPLVKKFNHKKIQPTNADRNIGAEALVTQTIDNVKAQGQVSVNGMDWTARAENDEIITEGTLVVVKKIEGAKLIVAPKN